MERVGQVVGIAFLLRKRPSRASGPVGVGERHEVVDVKIGNLSDASIGVRIRPSAAVDDAVAQIAEEYGGDAFFDEDFGSRVLTIPVGIDPELPLVPVLRREVGEHRCDRERWR